MKRNKLIALAGLCLLPVLDFSCGRSAPDQASEVAAVLPEAPLPATPEVQQLLVAANAAAGQVEGWLTGYEWAESRWVQTFDSTRCSFGKNGLAAAGHKMEGDGMTPSGKFALGNAFGYQAFPQTKMDYLQLTDDHYWISDTSSAQYNQLVDHFPEGLEAEKMRRKDHLYQYGIVIEYNTRPVVKGKGSAIFIHVYRRPGAPTAGCVAIPEARMSELIRWVDPVKQPMILLGTEETTRSELKQLLGN